MSALKHGLFRIGFILCDRCAINAHCEHFQAASECIVEKRAFEQLVNELTQQYGLDQVADKIIAERAAMYLIRITRAETYEANVGTTERSVFWGTYISKLDNNLRGLLNDLAVSRAKRKGLEKSEQLMINIEDLLERLANRPVNKEQGRRIAIKRQITQTPAANIYHALLLEWRIQKQTLEKRLAPKRQ
jgi:hypothetical protein